MQVRTWKLLLGLLLAPAVMAAPPGELDPTYGGTGPGYTLDMVGDSDEAHDLALYDDGSWVTAGISNTAGNLLPVLTKFKPDGALDVGFGVGGHAGPAAMAVAPNNYTQVTRFKDQLYLLVPAGNDLLVYNYSTSGVLNPAFGVGGVATIAAGAFNAVVDIAMWRNRPLIAGRARNTATGEQDFLVARLLPTGAPDASFGVAGVAVISLNGGPRSREWFTGIAVLSDLRIVLGGRTTKDITMTDPYDFVVARLRTNGSPDPTFGASTVGFTQIDLGYSDYGRRVAVYSNYQVLIAGSSCKTIDPTTGDLYCMQGTARVRSDGSIDTSWNGTGMNVVDLGGSFGLTVTDVALDKRERAVVSSVFNRAVDASFATLSRYDFLGAVDPSFIGGGHGMYSFGYDINGYHTVKFIDSTQLATCGYTGKLPDPTTLISAVVSARHTYY